MRTKGHLADKKERKEEKGADRASRKAKGWTGRGLERADLYKDSPSSVWNAVCRVLFGCTHSFTAYALGCDTLGAKGCERGGNL